MSVSTTVCGRPPPFAPTPLPASHVLGCVHRVVKAGPQLMARMVSMCPAVPSPVHGSPCVAPSPPTFGFSGNRCSPYRRDGPVRASENRGRDQYRSMRRHKVSDSWYSLRSGREITPPELARALNRAATIAYCTSQTAQGLSSRWTLRKPCAGS